MKVSIGRREMIISVVIVTVIILAIMGYFVFFNGKEKVKDNGGNSDTNRAPIADAGYDQVLTPGQEAHLNATGSYDPDGDPLTYIWDTDAGVDSDSDGIKDNDRDIYGETVTYLYPPPDEVITYIATVNVSDGEKWSTSITHVSFLIEDNDTAPEITLSCNFQDDIPYVSEAKFIITVDQASTEELMDNFTYILEDPDGGIIQDGILSELLAAPLNSSIRIMIDTPPIGRLNRYDSISMKESDIIVESCYLSLYYKQFLDPVGEVELTK